MLKLLPYNRFSKSAKVLADELGIRRLKLAGSRWRGRRQDVLINWGNCEPEYTDGKVCRVLNPPRDVMYATNKLEAFLVLANKEVLVPEFTTDKSEASEWTGITVCRHLLRANSGRGIEIVPEGDELPNAPLYVKYVKKSQEYRVHVGKLPDDTYSILDVQRKMRDRSVPDEEVNWQVRNMDGGFIFGREGVEPIPALINAAKDTVEALSLDFGAVDIIYNEHQDKYYVLEVNTAPGLTGTTLENYTTYFNSWR